VIRCENSFVEAEIGDGSVARTFLQSRASVRACEGTWRDVLSGRKGEEKEDREGGGFGGRAKECARSINLAIWMEWL